MATSGGVRVADLSGEGAPATRSQVLLWSKRKAPEPKAPDTKAPDPRTPGPRTPGPKVPEPKGQGPKVPEPKAPEPKEPGPKVPGPKEPGPKVPEPKEAKPKTSTGPDEVVVSTPTNAGLAKRTGLPLPFLYLAENACTLQLSCTAGLRDRLGDRTQDWLAQCKVNLAQAWCKKGSCKGEGLDPNSPDWLECYKHVYSRDCNRVNEPIECKPVRGRSMTIAPSNWKG